MNRTGERPSPAHYQRGAHMSLRRKAGYNQHQAHLDAANASVQRTRALASPGGKFPTLINTVLGLDVTINNQGQGYAAQQQEQRLIAFLTNDDVAYAPPTAGRARNPYALQSGWHEVDSTSIAAVKWDPERQSITVEFQSNRARYRYDRVPERIAFELVNAPSVGSYFESKIKRFYASTKLPE